MRNSESRQRALLPWLLGSLLLAEAGVADAADTGAIPTLSVQTLQEWHDSEGVPFALPTDVAAGVNGHLYVVDGGNDRVVVIDSTGTVVTSFGSTGRGDAELDRPVGVGIDGKGRVHVADRGNHRIQVFEKDGTYAYPVPLFVGDTRVEPVDVAVNKEGTELFVTSADRHEVIVFDWKGNLLRRWGGRGEEPGQFFHPATIEIAVERVYVVDVLNARVQCFYPDGRIVRVFGKRGAGPGTLFRPKGITVDSSGRVFVSDSYFGVIQAFETSGEFLYAIGEAGKPQVFEAPVGMTAVEGDIAVVEMIGGSLKRLQLGSPQ
jgi:DNA-binding beta-propeller fold protein YncE